MLKPIQLLVISADGNDWKMQFMNSKLQDERKIEVFVTNWNSLHLEAHSVAPKLVALLLEEDKTIYPDFVLFRSFPNDIHNTNYRNLVLALDFSGIGGVNSVEQVLHGSDRTVLYSKMLRASEKHGIDKFPIVPMKYHPNLRTGNRKRIIQLNFPTVIKVSSSYGGYGKMVAHNKEEYSDNESILCLQNDFFTEEPFVKHDYEFRVQVIGPHVRCFKRNSSSSWKNQQGNVKFEDHPWSSHYELWVDECRTMFGGMDMFALDVLHTSDNKDFILEINDYAMGFDYDYEPEDMKHVRELVAQRINEKFCGVEKANYIGRYETSNAKRGDFKSLPNRYLK